MLNGMIFTATVSIHLGRVSELIHFILRRCSYCTTQQQNNLFYGQNQMRPAVTRQFLPTWHAPSHARHLRGVPIAQILTS